MSGADWKWKVNEAVERIRTRYEFIGRKTGAPFLSIIYPMELELVVTKEWRTQCATLAPEFVVRSIDVLSITQSIVANFGVENLVASLTNPMPGSDAQSELAELWITAVCKEVKASLSAPCSGKPVASLERMAALFPTAGPRDVMQRLWDSVQCELNGPVIVLIPGHRVDGRTYSFLSHHNEFMYRGDPL